MDKFDVAPDKIGESAKKVLDEAVEEAKKRHHKFLSNEHIFRALIKLEWDAFSRAMKDLELDPHEIEKQLESCLSGLTPAAFGQEPEILSLANSVLKQALRNATRSARLAVESQDLFLAIFEEENGVASKIMSRHNVIIENLKQRIAGRFQEAGTEDAYLQKQYELPSALKQFATNLNLSVRQDIVSPVYFRDEEIMKVIEILCHVERPNSAMLIGESGVGKTAVVEGLARLIELDPERVPARLRKCNIVAMPMNTIIAGTQLRGMFEERIQSVIREIKENPHLILFVDEAHTMIGAGSALHSPSDAANILKSVLGRGEIRMIGATTLSEYRRYFEEDEALARRFRVVHVLEPTLDQTRQILLQLRHRLEKNYSVKILDEAIDMAVEMAPRYQRHLHLPDKVIGWLDTASVHTETEKRLEVTAADVVDVISGAAKIPKDMISRDVTDRFRNLQRHLSHRVIGQEKAVDTVANCLILNKGPLKDDFNRPDGVLLFLGPTGVGKTELAKAVAEFMFGDEKRMIRIDMAEYQGQSSVDKLTGMPQGIVGSERGGILTSQLRDNPYSVILLDEVEKASPELLSLLLSAFGDGWITDGHGKRAYLSDAIVIMTSNIGSRRFQKLANPFGFRSGHLSTDQIQNEINQELERVFSPELRNRIDEIILFEPLKEDEVREIAIKYIEQIRKVMRRTGKELVVKPNALELVVAGGYSQKYGARFLKRFIDKEIRTPISKAWQESNVFMVMAENNKVVVKECRNDGVKNENENSCKGAPA